MSRGTTPPRAVVADGRALERNLACFLLQEQGFVVVAEATNAADLTRAVKELSPDVVVAHESSVMDRNASVIPNIRRSSPWTRVIVLTTDPEATPPVLVAEADAVVQEGTGLKDLPFALGIPVAPEPATVPVGAAPWRTSTTIEPAADNDGTVVPLAPRRAGRPRWLERLQVVAAASILVLAVVLARGAGSLDPDDVSDPRLVAAFDSLEKLVDVVDTATPERIEHLVNALLAQRAAADAAGLDVSALDEEILALLAPLVDSLPTESGLIISALIAEIEEDALPPPDSTEPPLPSPPVDEPTTEPPAEETDPPLEEPSPDTEPSESPPPDESPPPPDESPPPPAESPPPDESPPPPAESPPPDPSESPSPDPSESPSPDPSESPSPTEPPSPDPTDPPSPDPTDPPSPDPTDPPSPDPTDPPSPDPTDPPSPDPTETPTKEPEPSPTKSLPVFPPDKETDGPDQDEDGDQGEPGADDGGTGAGSLIVIPPGLILLLTTSGFARRFTRRDRPDA